MGWRRFLSRASRDRDRADELDAHVELQVAELMDRGMTRDDAVRAARLKLGNPRVKREEIDDMNRLPLLDVLGRDLRYAIRTLRRSPAFTFTALATLALVIGANTAVFSLADAILLRPLPYPHPERLAYVTVAGQTAKGAFTNDSQDGTTWETIRDQAPAIDAAVVAGGFGHDVNLVAGHAAMTVGQARVSAGYFRVLGVPPMIGREFTRDEDRPGGPAVAVLSYDLWQRLFNGDADVQGRTIFLRGEPYDVVGVMPKGFENPGGSADVWTPVRPSRSGEGSGTNYGIIARVKDGRSWNDALAAMPPVDDGFFKRDVGGDASGTHFWFSLEPMQQTLVADERQPILMLGAAVLMVLLIACVNLAALLLARGAGRTKEIATRMALGSGRGAVIRQLMVESIVLGITGGALGVLIGYLGLESLKTLGGTTFDDWTHVTLDARALAVTAGLSLVTSALFGLAPALQASRFDVNHALSDGGSRSIAGGARHWTRRAMVIAEVALGVVLLVATGLLIRTFVNLRSLNPGFDPSHLVTASVSLQDARYKTSAQMNTLFNDTLRRLDASPGIESAGVSLELPYKRLLNMGFRFADLPANTGSISNVMYATPDFMKTLRIPLRAGRGIRDTDTSATAPVVMVNEGFVRLQAAGGDPIGRMVRVAGADRRIVGVMGDVQVTKSFLLKGMVDGPLTTAPLICLPAAQTPDSFMGMHIWFSPTWSVRASSDAAGEAALRQAIYGADPLLPIGRVRSMASVRSAATSQQQLLMVLVGVLGVAAMLLSAIGIHGLIAHSVAERTREFGIRAALGATAGQTVRSVALSGIRLAAIGAVVGVGLAWMAVTLVKSLLWGVTEHDPITFVVVAAFLLIVATISSLLPALRILRLDPAQTLRA